MVVIFIPDDMVSGSTGCSAEESGDEANKRLKPALRFHEAHRSQVVSPKLYNPTNKLPIQSNTVLLISQTSGILNAGQFKNKQILPSTEVQRIQDPPFPLKHEGRGLSPGHRSVTRMRSPRSGGAWLKWMYAYTVWIYIYIYSDILV